MTETNEKVEFTQTGESFTAHLNGCRLRLSQYEDGRWFVAVYAGYYTLQTNQKYAREISWSGIVATRAEAEAKAVEIAGQGEAAIKAMMIADLEQTIGHHERGISEALATLAGIDIDRAISRSTGFKAGFKAGQAVLRHVVWNVIGAPDEA